MTNTADPTPRTDRLDEVQVLSYRLQLAQARLQLARVSELIERERRAREEAHRREVIRRSIFPFF